MMDRFDYPSIDLMFRFASFLRSGLLNPNPDPNPMFVPLLIFGSGYPLAFPPPAPERLSQLGSYDWVRKYGFPAWFAIGALLFVVLESRKQYRRCASVLLVLQGAFFFFCCCCWWRPSCDATLWCLGR